MSISDYSFAIAGAVGFGHYEVAASKLLTIEPARQSDSLLDTTKFTFSGSPFKLELFERSTGMARAGSDMFLVFGSLPGSSSRAQLGALERQSRSLSDRPGVAK